MSESDPAPPGIQPSTGPDGGRTRYVMVPVPEELEDEFSGLILQTVLGSKLMRWDDHVVRRLRAALDDPSWALVALLARADGPVGVDDAARGLGTSQEEVGDIRNRVTAGCTAVERFDLIVEDEDEDEDQDQDQRPGWRIRSAAIPSVLAVLEEHPPTAGG